MTHPGGSISLSSSDAWPYLALKRAISSSAALFSCGV
jgi:hypothetical protein